MVQGSALADATEHVEQLAVGGACEAHAVGGHQRQSEATGQIHQCTVAVLLGTQPMTLQLHMQPVAEGVGKPLEGRAGAVQPTMAQRVSQWTLVAAGEAVKPVRMLGDESPGGPCRAFRPAASRGREEPAQVAVANGRANEQSEARERRSSDL